MLIYTSYIYNEWNEGEDAFTPFCGVNNYVNNVLKRVAGVLKTGVAETEAKGFFTRKGAFLSLFYT